MPCIAEDETHFPAGQVILDIIILWTNAHIFGYIPCIRQGALAMSLAKIIVHFPKISDSPIVLPLFINPVSAGFPSPADSSIENFLDIGEHLIKRPAATFFVRVSGDSMLPAGIHSGDLLVVDRSLQATDGRVVIAVVEAELTVKRLRLAQDKIFLIADNPDYAPIAITEAMDFSIWGVVTTVIHPL